MAKKVKDVDGNEESERPQTAGKDTSKTQRKGVGDEKRERNSKTGRQASVLQGRENRRDLGKRKPDGKGQRDRGSVSGRRVDSRNTWHGSTQTAFAGNSVLNTHNKGVFLHRGRSS